MRSSHVRTLELAAKAVETVERPQEGVLGHILGLVASHHPRRDARDHGVVPVHELLVRAEVAFQRLRHEDAVFLRARHGLERTNGGHRAER